MKKKLLLGLAGMCLLAVPNHADALGSAYVTFEGNNNVYVGDEIKVDVRVSDVKDTLDGVESFGGLIEYDKDILEYSRFESTNDNYEFLINEDICKVAGLDFTLNKGIKDDTKIFTIYFKAKNAGTSKVTLSDGRLTDTEGYMDYSIKNLKVVVNEKMEETTTAIAQNKVVLDKNNEAKTISTTTTKKVEETTTVKVEEETNEIEETVNTKEDNLGTKIIKGITNFFKAIKNIFKR